jgi:Ca2+-binding EF-hand superfamily protein
MPRDEVDAYMTLIVNNYRLASSSEIPERYKPLDSNGDGYISFEELLKTIDQYFDFQLDLNLDELREVNEFFFSQ